MNPGPVRRPAVAGGFYPSDPDVLRAMVDRLLAAAVAEAEAARSAAATAAATGGPSAAEPSGEPPRALAGPLLGLLVPHAGLVFSGLVAAHAWRLLASDPPGTAVLLGTNHTAGWLRGIGTWDAGAWDSPLGPVQVDEELAGAIAGLGPGFCVDRAAHDDEHSLEVQMPFLRRVAPAMRIVPLAVSTGTGAAARDVGERLGTFLGERLAAGERIVIVASTDAAHYPAARDAERATEALLPPLLALDPVGLAGREASLVTAGIPGLRCGMCGIEPSVVGLAALRALGATRGELLAAATSADAGGDPRRTVGYIAAAFRA